MATVTNIYTYPLKSAKHITSISHHVDEYGLVGDRRFIISDLQGNMLTGRTHPQIAQIVFNADNHNICLSHPSLADISMGVAEFGKDTKPITVWADSFKGHHCHQDIDAWLSQLLGEPCMLLRYGEESLRSVKRYRSNKLAFADGYPLLLISEASLTELNKRSSDNHDMLEFRPNIVVDGESDFIEDTWRRFKIGEVEFEVVKPCSRCVFTTLKLGSSEYRGNNEPVKTLKTFRQGKDNEVYFGQNVIARNQGQIRVGDKVEVLSYQTPEAYPDTSKDTPAMDNKMVNVLFDNLDKSLQINTHEPILDQALAAGVFLPRNCQAGRCGRCKMILVSGEVNQGEQSALTPFEIDNGAVLTCCATAKTDLVLNLE
ncbi:YcbX family protein [Paraferrimonas sp. SM1919]|uniref:YcbX family protein n=1 Tax=Paraferrimonas sp. SM1919 TaxID=2662263 RepID=UPI0013D5D128|nr:MOSC N-terminal beta barrel domain-containing protein [Paraferrimonas sp. SM1919]